MSLAGSLSNGVQLLQNEDWNVRVVGAAPEECMPLTLAAVHRYWSASQRQQTNGSWIVQLWYSDSSKPLAEQKFDRRVLKLSSPHWTESSPPFVQLSSHPHQHNASSANESVYVYTLSNGRLQLWYLTRKDLEKPLGPPCHASCDISRLMDANDEFTCLSVEWISTSSSPTILVGTRASQVYQVTQSHGPLSLRAAHLQAKSSFGILSSLFASSTSAGYQNDPITCLLNREKDIYALTSTHLIVYKNGQQAESLDLLETLASRVTADPFEGLRVNTAAVSSSHIHILVTTQHYSGKTGVYTRVYWMQLKLEEDLELENPMLLDRFAQPPSYMELVPCGSRLTYGLFQETENIVCIMALQEEDRVFTELSLPQAEAFLMEPDPMASHQAVTCWSREGTRIHIVHPLLPGGTAASTSGSTDRQTIKLLAGHLQVAFRKFYISEAQEAPLPPSLLNGPSKENLSHAIIMVAKAKGEAQQNLEQHLLFIKFLQLTNLYGQLDSSTQGELLRVGSAKAVRQELARARVLDMPISPDDNEILLGDWWKPLPSQSTTPNGSAFPHFLTILEACHVFQEEHVQTTYQLYQYNSFLPWTSRVEIQTQLIQIWNLWNDKMSAKGLDGDQSSIDRLVELGLASFAATYATYTSRTLEAEKAREEYVTALHNGIRILIKVSPNHALAWDLSQRHDYYRGLCDLAFEHERKLDADQYSLDPFFKARSEDERNDIVSLEKFSFFVLMYHIERGYMGHALNYGRRCPDVMRRAIHQKSLNDSHLWVHNVGVGNFGQTVEALVQDQSSKTARQTKRLMSLASLSNKIENEEAVDNHLPKKRARLIDSRLDCAVAQESVLGRPDSPLLEPERLLLAILDRASSTDSYLEALGVCMAIESPVRAEQCASRVWRTAIEQDAVLWKHILSGDSTTIVGSAKEDTQLARLVFLCSQVEDDVWKKSVATNPSMKQLAVQHLPSPDSMLRLWKSLESSNQLA